MKYMHIAFCEQAEPECQGFAADDHIDKHCLVVRATPEFLNEAEPLIRQIDQIAQERLNQTTTEWMRAHPDATECTAEGEEFVGLRWLEHNTATYETSGDYDTTSQSEVLERLRAMLADLRA